MPARVFVTPELPVFAQEQIAPPNEQPFPNSPEQMQTPTAGAPFIMPYDSALAAATALSGACEVMSNFLKQANETPPINWLTTALSSVIPAQMQPPGTPQG